MQHISINVSEAIKYLLPDTLEKDLHDNERICPLCGGLGIIKKNMPYVLSKDKVDKYYNNEYFVWCPNCYFGVQKLCEFCGTPLAKGFSGCKCEKALEKEEAVRKQNYQNKIGRAKEIDLKQVSYYMYDEESQDYFADENEFADHYFNLYLDEIEENHIPFDEYFEKYVPKVLWNCDVVKMYIDADSIVSDACEELHEDAVDNVDGMDELQEFLDKWCAKQTGTTTYYPDYHEYVKVRRKWFNEAENES